MPFSHWQVIVFKQFKILCSEASQKNKKLWGWIMRKQKVNWFSNDFLVGSLKIDLSERTRVILWLQRFWWPWHSPSLFYYFPKAVRVWQTQIDFAFPCSMHRIVLSYVWQVLTFSGEKNSVEKVVFYSSTNGSKTLSVADRKKTLNSRVCKGVLFLCSANTCLARHVGLKW